LSLSLSLLFVPLVGPEARKAGHLSLVDTNGRTVLQAALLGGGGGGFRCEAAVAAAVAAAEEVR